MSNLSPGYGGVVKQRFGEAAKRWKDETKYLSVDQDIVEHPSYLEIIDMGWWAVPLIIDDILHSDGKDCNWDVALTAITGEDPVQHEMLHTTWEEINRDWVTWWDRNSTKNCDYCGEGHPTEELHQAEGEWVCESCLHIIQEQELEDDVDEAMRLEDENMNWALDDDNH